MNLGAPLLILAGVAIVRIGLAAIALWSFVRWLHIMFSITKAHSDSLVVETGPDATPYEQLPTARQRLDATLSWHEERVKRIGWLWEGQIASTLLVGAALAASATLIAPWSAWYVWIPLGALSLWALWRARGLDDQRRRALAALASRRDILMGKVTTP